MFGAKVGDVHGEGDGSWLTMPMQQSSLSLSACDSNGNGTLSEATFNHEVTPAIKMIIGDWYVDELGMPTREITARD